MKSTEQNINITFNLGDIEQRVLAELTGIVGRSGVLAFAMEMERELAIQDDEKGPEGWRDNLNEKYVMHKLEQRVEQLQFAVRNNYEADNIRKLAADIGNYAMMIADVKGELRP